MVWGRKRVYGPRFGGNAAEYWVPHAQVGNASSKVIRTIKTLFDSDQPHFAAWLRIYDMDHYWSSQKTAKPLYYSAICGFYDLVEYLINKHPQDVNYTGGGHDCPLVAALHGGHIQVAELLFQHVADVSIRGPGARLPLHVVVRWSNNSAVGAVQFLLRHGADVDARNGGNFTALHLASYRLDLELVPMLLDHGANVNAEENQGKTPLHRVLEDDNYYSYERLIRVAQMLIERGADVNKPDNEHETPLHLASRFLFLEVAWILLNGGADPNAENKEGKISFQLVRERLREEMEHEPLPSEEDPITRAKGGARRARGVALMGLLYGY